MNLQMRLSLLALLSFGVAVDARAIEIPRPLASIMTERPRAAGSSGVLGVGVLVASAGAAGLMQGLPGLEVGWSGAWSEGWLAGRMRPRLSLGMVPVLGRVASGAEVYGAGAIGSVGAEVRPWVLERVCPVVGVGVSAAGTAASSAGGTERVGATGVFLDFAVGATARLGQSAWLSARGSRSAVLVGAEAYLYRLSVVMGFEI